MSVAGRVLVRDAALVARFELGEALRTRLLLVMVFLFVGAGALGAYGFARAVERIEAEAARALDAPTTAKPGAALNRLADSQSYRQTLRIFVRDRDKADYYAALPPMAVFFGWASFMFTPFLVLFTSSDTIATEVGARSIRYTLLRTSRLAYAIGKFAGQALLVVAVTALMGATFFVVAWSQLSGFEAGATALALLSYWPRVVIYNLPFLGWAMLASMITSSANLARIVALGGGVGLSILAALSRAESIRGTGSFSNVVWDIVGFLTPGTHSEGLSYPPGGAFLADVCVCLALTVLYVSLGLLRLRRRDV